MFFLPLIKVLILAGGLNAEQNHHSHLVHVQGLQALLNARGVPAADVGVFWADGVDPQPDRAVVKAAAPPDLWLIEGLSVGRDVDPGPELEHTVFSAGETPQPARRADLKRWLSAAGAGLGAGDTLLIAVTDHGSPDPEGGTQSRIELWEGETWNPTELLQDLAPVSDATRVVLWMSQCFSGGFADLYRQRANLCGAFSAPADRVAYGCYPELAGRTDVGHFQRLLEALGRHGQLAAAHDEVLLNDDTPDVPHLTSDALFFSSLTAAAEQGGGDAPVFIDTRLSGASSPGQWRLAAAIALRYGLGSLRDYSAVLDLLDLLGAARFALESWSGAWHHAWDNAREVLTEALRPPAEGKNRAEQVRAQAGLLADARLAWDRAPADQRARLTALGRHVEQGFQLAERIDLQEAAALRVVSLMARIAGPASLKESERRQLAALQACESQPLFAAVPSTVAAVEPPDLAPAIRIPAEVEALRPGYLGLAFRDRPGYLGVEVEHVQPGSLLLALDLQPGDQILHVNGQPVVRRGGFREAILLAEPGTPLRLSLRRGTTALERVLPSPPMPLPGPTPQVGEVVGDLRLKALGAPLPPVGEGRPVVLLYWATWCKPCKNALPALAAWATAHQADVVAVTDEDSAVVEKFLSRFGGFPFPIGLDVEEETRRLFGVEQVPVFVLIDRQRRLVQVGVGFEDQIPLSPPPG